MKLSAKAAEARLESPVTNLSNLEMHFIGTEGQEIPGALYGKVVQTMGSNTDCYIRFTSISPEIEMFLGDRFVISPVASDPTHTNGSCSRSDSRATKPFR